MDGRMKYRKFFIQQRPALLLPPAHTALHQHTTTERKMLIKNCWRVAKWKWLFMFLCTHYGGEEKSWSEQRHNENWNWHRPDEGWAGERSNKMKTNLRHMKEREVYNFFISSPSPPAMKSRASSHYLRKASLSLLHFSFLNLLWNGRLIGRWVLMRSKLRLNTENCYLTIF